MDITSHFKTGYKTTEFWVAIVAAAIALVNSTTGLDLDSETIIGLGVTVASYIIGRSYLKANRVKALAETPEAEVYPAPPVG